MCGHTEAWIAALSLSGFPTRKTETTVNLSFSEVRDLVPVVPWYISPRQKNGFFLSPYRNWAVTDFQLVYIFFQKNPHLTRQASKAVRLVKQHKEFSHSFHSDVEGAEGGMLG